MQTDQTITDLWEIRVNSNLVAGSLDFYPTSAWTVWNDQSIVVTLNAGNNVIRATGIASDGGRMWIILK